MEYNRNVKEQKISTSVDSCFLLKSEDSNVNQSVHQGLMMFIKRVNEMKPDAKAELTSVHIPRLNILESSTGVTVRGGDMILNKFDVAQGDLTQLNDLEYAFLKEMQDFPYILEVCVIRGETTDFLFVSECKDREYRKSIISKYLNFSKGKDCNFDCLILENGQIIDKYLDSSALRLVKKG